MKNWKTLLTILGILVIIGGCYVFSQKVQAPTKTIQRDNPDAGPTTEEEGQMITIGILIGQWEQTQSTFSIKAGESGTFNHPDKIQFIRWDKMLVHYDDGLRDYISLVQYQDGPFAEIKNLGVGSVIPKTEWQALVNEYGYGNPTNYKINYKTDESGVPIFVAENLFVK